MRNESLCFQARLQSINCSSSPRVKDRTDRFSWFIHRQNNFTSTNKGLYVYHLWCQMKLTVELHHHHWVQFLNWFLITFYYSLRLLSWILRTTIFIRNSNLHLGGRFSHFIPRHRFNKLDYTWRVPTRDFDLEIGLSWLWVSNISPCLEFHTIESFV